MSNLHTTLEISKTALKELKEEIKKLECQVKIVDKLNIESHNRLVLTYRYVIIDDIE